MGSADPLKRIRTPEVGLSGPEASGRAAGDKDMRPTALRPENSPTAACFLPDLYSRYSFRLCHDLSLSVPLLDLYLLYSSVEN